MRVCRRFFLATLAFGEGYVQHAMMNSQQGYDGRGKYTAHNKTIDRQLKHVKEHIQSFPCVESHYTRQDTQRRYLDASLNITKMYQLYEEKCKDDGMKFVSCRKYRDIFASNFNLSFYKPPEDQCLSSTKHTENQKQGTETEEEKRSYQEHINITRQEKRERKITVGPKKTQWHMSLHLTYRLSFLPLAAWSASCTPQGNCQCTTSPYTRLGMVTPVVSFGMRHKAWEDPVKLPHASSSISSQCQWL